VKTQRTVLCVACRATYVIDADTHLACPQCGSPSWIATRPVETSPNGRAAQPA
jgi:hypothetical protein